MYLKYFRHYYILQIVTEFDDIVFQVEFEFVEGTKAYEPPWSSVSIYDRGGLYNSDYSDPLRSPAPNKARLYPNVKGCGYPPELNCEEFYET